MSDVFEGPGWWMASDGKWYPPHLHADASYRARWVNVDAVVAAPDTSQDVLVEPGTEPATTISQPAAAASWVPEQPRAARPVADVPPANTAPFVASDKVAERAAALADTARVDAAAEAIVEPATTEQTAPVPATPAPAPVEERLPSQPAPTDDVVAPPATPPIESRVPAQPDPAPVDPPVIVAAPMPSPIVAPHESPTPLQPNGVGPDGFVAFAGPSSTPVSEILNRLGDPHTGANGADNNGSSPTDTDAWSPAEDLSAPVESEGLDRLDDVGADRVKSDAKDQAVDAVETTTAHAPQVRIGPAHEPQLDPIDFEPAVPDVPDPTVPASRARLEVGAPTERGEERFGLLTPNRPTEQRITLQEQPPLSSSTDLVPVTLPEIAVYSDGPSLHDRLVAAVLFLSGVALIVGTFLVWTTAPGEELTGWEMSDGIVTIIAGVLGSAAAGPIFVGFRHVIPKAIAILSGLVALVVPGLRALEVLSDSALAETGVGTGFWIVFGGSIAMLLAGVADQSRFGD